MSCKHARLSASSAHRWLVCQGSVNASKGRSSTSAVAAQGTLAHNIAARCLNTNSSPSDWLLRRETIDGHQVEVDQEMVDGVQFYIDALKEDVWPGDKHWVEMPLQDALQRIDSDLGGTADFVRYRPSDMSLRVWDFKYGSGVYVEVEANKQELLYGLGVMLQLDNEVIRRSVKEVTLTIVQPRFEGAPPVRDWKFKAHEILSFIADVQEAAVKTRKKDAALVAGDHCKFCPASRDCPELEKRQHALVAKDFADLPAVAPEKLATALGLIALVKERIKAIEEFAYAEAQRGVVIPGYKLVDKVPRRHWKDETAVIQWAALMQVDPYASKEVLSPAQLEKKVGKKLKPALAEFYESKSSGTVLVPVADDRPPAKRITADDFAAIETTADKKEAIPVSLF